MAFFTDAVDDARIALQALADRVEGIAHPTLRLGVTGLSRAGKTIFTTALIHALTKGARMPVFEPYQSGRIARAELQPQPDDAVPRFAYEGHLEMLGAERRWPSSTTRVSELRLAIRYATRRGSLKTLNLDIVDYPGEWLLDLPLLNMSYADFARQSLALARAQARAEVAAPFLAAVADAPASGPADEARAREVDWEPVDSAVRAPIASEAVSAQGVLVEQEPAQARVVLAVIDSAPVDSAARGVLAPRAGLIASTAPTDLNSIPGWAFLLMGECTPYLARIPWVVTST